MGKGGDIITAFVFQCVTQFAMHIERIVAHSSISHTIVWWRFYTTNKIIVNLKRNLQTKSTRDYQSCSTVEHQAQTSRARHGYAI